MKKVLIVTNILQFGGSDLAAIRFQQALDKNKFECTYCVRNDEKIGPMEPYVAKTGVRIIHQPKSTLGYIDSYKYFLNLFEKEHFDIVHCHLPFFAGFVLKAAYEKGVKKRIVHSHFSQPMTYSDSRLKEIIVSLYRNVMRAMIYKYATDIIGCSEAAGIFLCGRKAFSKKGIVLRNGIDTSQYEYRTDYRTEIRNELELDDKIVLGHIGQFNIVKNQSFLLDIYNKYHERHNNSVLLLIGEDDSYGGNKSEIIEKCERLGLSDKVVFTGNRDDIPKVLSALDCLVFPSLHEALPLTLIESQVAKLPCLVSDRVSSAVKMNENLIFESIDNPTEKWCEKIDILLSQNRALIDNSNAVKTYDMSYVIKELEAIYTN